VRILSLISSITTRGVHPRGNDARCVIEISEGEGHEGVTEILGGIL
jgi:hypothetical protein